MSGELLGLNGAVEQVDEPEDLQTGVLGWVSDVADGKGLAGSLRATVVVGII